MRIIGEKKIVRHGNRTDKSLFLKKHTHTLNRKEGGMKNSGRKRVKDKYTGRLVGWCE